MNRIEKQELIDKLKSEIYNKNFILSGFSGLTVAEISDLRIKLRKSNCSTTVVKNRLLSIVLKDLINDGYEEYLKDTTLLSIQKDSSSFDALKTIVDYAKNNEKFFVKAGYIEGKSVSKEDVVKISNLPTREILLSQLLSQLNAPITKFVNVVNNPVTKLVYALSAIKDKK